MRDYVAEYESWKRWYAGTSDEYRAKRRARNAELFRRRREDPTYRARANARERQTWRETEYGLTKTEILELFESSDGFCAICYEEPAIQIDHDHVTGKVRGVLCAPCNRGLGQFGDDPERLEAAREYLVAS